jgi:hypothetical protein
VPLCPPQTPHANPGHTVASQRVTT